MRTFLMSIAVCGAAAAAAQAGPTPIGSSDVTLRWTTPSGPAERSGSYAYTGTGPGSAVPLGGDAALGYFNAANTFGRRTLVPSTIAANETLLTHAFFKADHADDFFADITPDSLVTLEVENIQFAEPTYVVTDTAMMHRFWDVDQLDLVDLANGTLHHHAHNHDTVTDPYRDLEQLMPLVFSPVPPLNYRLGTLTQFSVTGNGTTNLGFSLTAPYSIFRHLEDDPGNPPAVPAGLPAPHGFLEPFHFHVEFLVSDVPEPSALCLMACGALTLARRRG